MDLLKTMNNLLAKKGFDWSYYVISHIAENSAKYVDLGENYIAITSLLTGTSVNPKNMELLTFDFLPLPNCGGSVLFAICYRDVTELALTTQLQKIVKTNGFSKNLVMVFLPTPNLINSGDTDIVAYKIENTMVNKLT